MISNIELSDSISRVIFLEFEASLSVSVFQGSSVFSGKKLRVFSILPLITGISMLPSTISISLLSGVGHKSGQYEFEIDSLIL